LEQLDGRRPAFASNAWSSLLALLLLLLLLLLLPLPPPPSQLVFDCFHPCIW
jgi:hypothetical protein